MGEYVKLFSNTFYLMIMKDKWQSLARPGAYLASF